MPKIITKKEIAPILIIAVVLILAASFYLAPCVPDKVPSHWNVQGQIDGWSGKTFTALFFPLLILGLYILMLLAPKLDPFHHNYEDFAWPYFVVRLSLVIFLSAFFVFVWMVAIGMQIDIVYFVVPLFTMLMVVLGVLMPKLKKNYFLGIRTPWTLQSDVVWAKTHRMAGVVFIVAGILIAPSIFIPPYAFWIFLAVVLAAAFTPIVYSYILYRRLGLFKKH